MAVLFCCIMGPSPFVEPHTPRQGAAVSTIRLEILPWLSRPFDGEGITRVVLERQVAEGATVRDLLDQLAAEYPAFGRTLYDPDGRLAVHISIIVNDRLYELAGGLAAEVRAGDTVRLLPAFSGG
jgi:molybdopterin converting factor small subunit